MFRTVLLSIIRSLSLYTQQWYMSYRFADRLRGVPSWSCSQAVSKPVWHIPLLCVQWKTPDDGQRNCPKHLEFYSKNKFEKLVHLVDTILRTNIVIQETWPMRIKVTVRSARLLSATLEKKNSFDQSHATKKKNTSLQLRRKGNERRVDHVTGINPRRKQNTCCRLITS